MKQGIAGLLFWAVTAGLGAQAALPDGFGAFHLGMNLQDLKSALKGDASFQYSGEPDVTLLSQPNTNLIDVPGQTYFSRGVFQIVDGKLYSIVLELNLDELDYFTMYSTLTKKYGPPTALDPSSARWENPSVRMSLEKPATVKYLDMAVFQKLQKESRTQKALQALTRDKFLETF